MGFWSWLAGGDDEVVTKGDKWSRKGVERDLARSLGARDDASYLADEVADTFKTYSRQSDIDVEWDLESGSVYGFSEDDHDIETLDRLREEALRDNIDSEK